MYQKRTHSILYKYAQLLKTIKISNAEVMDGIIIMIGLDFDGLGWKLKVQEKKRQHILGLPKQVIIGNMLNKGDSLYAYLVRDGNKKKGLYIPLDTKLEERKESVIVENIVTS